MINPENHMSDQNFFLKEHSCLVPWESLDRISQVFGKDYKEKDRDLIRNIGNILSAINWGVEELQ